VFQRRTRQWWDHHSHLHHHLSSSGGGGDGIQEEPAAPVVICDENLDADHDDDVPLRIRSINSILGPVQLQGLVRRVLA
jgi:murein endopeptidase